MRLAKTRRLFAAALAAACAAAVAAAADESAWVLAERSDSPIGGYALYRRQEPGAAFSTWRLEAELDAPPELVARATLADLLAGSPSAVGRRQRVLRREGDVFWVHTEIAVAFAADRDAVLRMERKRDPANGALRIEWNADPDAGPPPAPGVVRLVVSRGFWEFTPAGHGRTHASYESYTEPGGPFPAWLVDTMSAGRVLQGLADLRRAVADAAPEPPPAADRASGG
jgi:hypothetical protein